MSLVPHLVTALAESDADGTNGKNIVENAVVSLFDTSGNVATLYDNDEFSNPSTTKQTDSQGQVVVYVEAGEYDEEINGSTRRRVLIGSPSLTTMQLINTSRGSSAGDTVMTTGFSETGDGGASQWVATSTTGQTPSQTPASRAAGELVDGLGRLWRLATPNIVNPLQVGAVPNQDSTQALIACFNHANNGVINGVPETFLISSTITINRGMTINGNGMIFQAAPNKPLTTRMFTTFNGDAPTRTVRGLIIRSLTFDGANLPPQRWLQNPTNGATISDPESDYQPGGIIGDGGNIADVVAANRRNPNYTQTVEMLELSCTEDTLVEGCTFRNHFGRAITEGGGRNVTIRNNNFIDLGKNDGPYHAIWTQSFGNPNNPTSTFLDTQNIIIEGNFAQNLERGFAIFNPTMGGVLRNNTVRGWGESCVFSNTFLNVNGNGVTEMTGNNFINGSITDIVCQAFEVNGLPNLNISRNFVFNSDGEAFGISGCIDSDVRGNRTLNVYRTHTIPYGPFSERFAFAVGTDPIAGNDAPVEDGSVYSLGTFSGVGCDNLTISGNTVRETRARNPSVFKQFRSGGNNLSQACYIFDNTISAPSSMNFINTTTGNVWDVNIPLEISRNKGHASNETVSHLKSWVANETGAYVVDIGFRPRSVNTIAATNNSALGRQSTGSFSWNNGGVRNDNNISFSVNTGQIGILNQSDVITIRDDSNNVTFRAEFVGWTETGFTLNVLVASDAVNAVFYCNP